MGRAFVLVVLGLGIIVGLISRTLSARTNDSWSSAVASYRRVCAKNIVESAADIYINKLRSTPTLRGKFPLSLSGGVDTVTISQPDTTKDSVLVFSKAVFESLAGNSTVCVTRSGSFSLNAAVMFSTGASGGSWIFNDSQIDGRNYNYSTGALDGTSPSMRGFTKPNNAVPLTFNNGGVTGSGGGPLPRDTVSLGAAQLDFTSLPNVLYAKANTIISASTTFTTATWGTHAAPKITFITNTVIVNGACAGEGVLVIAGPLNCNSTFSFKGLVIFCTKDPSWAGAANASFSVLTSGATVYGAMINCGDNISYTANTSSNYFRYSKTMIDYTCSTLGIGGSGGKYSVAYWKE